jgi:hypothetical protein
MAIEVAEGTTLKEPELFYLPFRRARKSTEEPTKHRLPFYRVRSIAVGVQNAAALSEAALSIQRIGQLDYFTSQWPLLELHFEGVDNAHFDFRPVLPLVLCGHS